MAATITEQKVISIGQSDALVWGTIAGDNSYPTGGWALDPAGSTDYENLVAEAAGYLCWYDAANKKLLLYRQTAATGALVEVPNATDLSALTSIKFFAVRPA